METVWVQIFILTIAECVAPVGKSVCQEQQFELQFLSRTDCEYALQQFVAAKDELDYVILNRAKSGCIPSAMEVDSYQSRDAINAANSDITDWRMPGNTEARRAEVNADHRERLAVLKTCEETGGAAPCKIGEVIVEEATGESVEIWRRDK